MSMYRRAHAGFDYELWLRRGHTGTPDDFLEWLREGSFNARRPEDYGAKADGQNDDSGAIQNAIEAAGDGGYIKLTAGATYLVKETLTLRDGQTFDGSGATLKWEAPCQKDENGDIVSAPYIMTAEGGLGAKINLTAKPRIIGNAPATPAEYGTDQKAGFTELTVGEDPKLKAGDRIIIQSQRNALAPESCEYWCGTPTRVGAVSYWSEPRRGR